MRKKNFALLMADFAMLTQKKHMAVNHAQGVTCKVNGFDCYIEDGAKIGCREQLILIVPINSTLASERQVHYNSDFSLTRDGYLAEIKNKGCCYIRHISMLAYPEPLLRELNETISCVITLKNEIAMYVVD